MAGGDNSIFAEVLLRVSRALIPSGVAMSSLGLNSILPGIPFEIDRDTDADNEKAEDEDLNPEEEVIDEEKNKSPVKLTLSPK